MFNKKLSQCPACDHEVEFGFSSRSSPLSFLTFEKVRRYVHMDEDLNRAGLKMILPAKASYDLAYHCPRCRILIVDYSRKVSSKAAKARAALIE